MIAQIDSERQIAWHHYQKQAHSTVVGLMRVLKQLHSPQLHNQRDILVYLPPSYHQHYHRRYPVLYMHDGQNLFDQATSFVGEWEVDETMEKLSEEGIEAIVVGIPNIGKTRLDEYTHTADEHHGGGKGDAYLGFVVDTVKPLVDADFRTLPDKAHTGIMGSSLGGLISLYAFFAYPHTFGFVGAMSPSVWFADQALTSFIDRRRTVLNPGRIYLDAGTREYSGFFSDKLLLRARSRRYYGQVRRLKRILVNKGYRSRHNLQYVEEKGGTHSESAWSRRLPDALRFLLPPFQDE